MSYDAERQARFENVYRDNRGDLLAYLLRRTADPQDAADLLAETFLVAWRRIDDVPQGAAARLWLFGVARNQLANRRRRDETARQLAGSLRALLQRAARSDGFGASDTSTALAVRCALERLGDADREVMMLAAYEELTPREIAVVTGRTEGSVRVRLHRARRRLAGELDDEQTRRKRSAGVALGGHLH